MLLGKEYILEKIEQEETKANLGEKDRYTQGYLDGLKKIKYMIVNAPMVDLHSEYASPEGRSEILDEAKLTITQDRVDIYGEPEDSFKTIAELWEVYLYDRLNGELTSLDVSIMMLLLKVARSIKSPFHIDNYIDMAGYAACAGEEAVKLEVE